MLYFTSIHYPTINQAKIDPFFINKLTINFNLQINSCNVSINLQFFRFRKHVKKNKEVFNETFKILAHFRNLKINIL